MYIVFNFVYFTFRYFFEYHKIIKERKMWIWIYGMKRKMYGWGLH